MLGLGRYDNLLMYPFCSFELITWIDNSWIDEFIYYNFYWNKIIPLKEPNLNHARVEAAYVLQVTVSVRMVTHLTFLNTT